MGQINNIVGQKFGRLTVIELLPLRHDGTTWYKCKCECGGEKTGRRNSLITGNLLSCGCIPRGREPGFLATNFTGYNNLSGKYWSHVKYGAKIRNLEFEITIEEAWKIFEKQNGKCAISGLPINIERRNIGIHHQTASLDRIDSTKGYLPNNVQWVHIDIQKLKNNIPEDRLLFLSEQISQFNSERLKNLLITDRYSADETTR